MKLSCITSVRSEKRQFKVNVKLKGKVKAAH